MTNANQENMAVKLAGVGALTPAGFDAKCKQFFAENSKRLAGLAQNPDDARTIFLAAMNAVSRSPYLLDAVMGDFTGFARAIATSCELRLFPGPMQECAYVPIKNGKTGKLEINWWPMYQGLVKLAFNSGLVKSISCDVVYEKDDFEFEKGSNEFLRHKPKLVPREERGARICAYAVIHTTHGQQIEVVPMQSIEATRKKSRAGNSEYSPWNIADGDNYDAMARKTALKRALKMIPKSASLSKALEADDEVELPQSAVKTTVDMVQALHLPSDAELRTMQEPENLPTNEQTELLPGASKTVPPKQSK